MSVYIPSARLACRATTLGLPEAGNWPGGVKAVSENFAAERRTFAVGVFNSGSTFGSIIAPPIVAAIAALWNWRLMFVAIGLTGLVWVMLWQLYYRPALLQPVAAGASPRHAFQAYFRDRAVWGLMIGRFLADPIWRFYAFWLPEYLAQRRAFSPILIGSTVWIPFVLAGAGGCG